jgi:hypothetical protein
MSDMTMLLGLGIVAVMVYRVGRSTRTRLDRIKRVAVLASERAIEAFNASMYPNLYAAGYRRSLRDEYLLEEKLTRAARGWKGGRPYPHPQWSIRLKHWTENSKTTETLGRLYTWLSQYEELAEEGDLSLAEARFLWHNALAHSHLMANDSLDDKSPSVRGDLDKLEERLREGRERWRKPGVPTRTIRNARPV